jgi:hypothetical protein
MGTANGAAARRAMGEAIVRTQSAKYLTDGIALGYRYSPSPICWGEASPAPPLSVSEYHPTAYPGSRAPHAWLSAERSILDAFGKGFTLLSFDSADASPIERAFAVRSVPLTVMPVADPAIAALYERTLVLVRPDGHVAWRGDAVPPNPLALVDRVRGGA